VDETIIGDAMNIGISGVLEGTREAKFHLLIHRRRLGAVEENKTHAAAARVQA